jgi:membrane-associated protease RseP (regulator of RpoE activity)
MNLLPLLLCLFVEPPAAVAPAVVPVEILPTRHFCVQIKVNGKGPYRVIFDTGAPVSLVNNRLAKDAGLLEGKGGGMLFGMQGDVLVKELEVGGLKAKDVKVIVMDHPALTAAAKVLGPVDGIIGFPFWARYKMGIDYQAKQLTFVPNDYQPADLMASMMATMMGPKTAPKKHLGAPSVWGLQLEKSKSDEEAGVDVTAVLPDSAAAAAGLKAGDRLLTLDGTWTDALEDAYRAAGGVKAGKGVEVRYRRDGKEQTATVTPRAGL